MMGAPQQAQDMNKVFQNEIESLKVARYIDALEGVELR